MTGTFELKQAEILLIAASGTLKSMATSAFSKPSKVSFPAFLMMISWPLSKAIFSITFPILPYPNSAIFIVNF
ncbi:hypothetical protein D3C80_1355600 [compost metagenome]